MVPAPALVVLLTGPSGSGKSYVARSSGLPVLALDSFYKDGDNPTVPRVRGVPDWDAPEAWDADRALQAVARLATERRLDVPRYDIAHDRAVGTHPIDIGSAPAFVAEGIFAWTLVAGCRERGILADAICLRAHPAVTFYRRLVRDLGERRKPRTVLVRRGIALYRDEAVTVTEQVTSGTYPCSREDALFRIRLAAHARTSTPAP
ncbi:MAG: uridine kinase family protein [Actinomycetes bacterium]